MAKNVFKIMSRIFTKEAGTLFTWTGKSKGRGINKERFELLTNLIEAIKGKMKNIAIIMEPKKGINSFFWFISILGTIILKNDGEHDIMGKMEKAVGSWLRHCMDSITKDRPVTD